MHQIQQVEIHVIESVGSINQITQDMNRYKIVYLRKASAQSAADTL